MGWMVSLCLIRTEFRFEDEETLEWRVVAMMVAQQDK